MVFNLLCHAGAFFIIMKHIINIDWLQLFCIADYGHFGGVTQFINYRWQYHRHEYGTAAYQELYSIKIGRTLVCNVQCEPRTNLMQCNSVIVKFDNRLLYRRDKWDIIQAFLMQHKLTVHNITRLDLCADFNDFECISPPKLILNFLQSKWRHKGRGAGQAYFIHYNKQIKGYKTMQQLLYNGISFGSRESDVRVYLYNKSLELATQTDKPYIRDQWINAGLDPRKNVWRLEISMKSDAMKLYNKTNKQSINITYNKLTSYDYVKHLYYALVKKYFSFIKNDHPVNNITREPIIQLFNEANSATDIGILREVGCSNLSDKVFIKSLYTAAYKYPFIDLDKDALQAIADKISSGVDLFRWKLDKQQTWEQPYTYDNEISAVK